VLARLAGGGLLHPRPLPASGHTARVALVQAGASLLRGDEVSIAVALGPAASVELVDVAATIAHDARSGAPARLEIGVALESGARLVWNAKPLVVAAGSAVRRDASIDLACGAQALLRDTLVLGRAGERPGALRTRTSVTHDGSPLHVDGLDTAELRVLRSPAILGEATVVDTVARYGTRGEGDGVLQLDGPGSLLVQVADQTAATEAAARAAFARWRAELA
jgi:urease accessory protein